MKTRFFVDLYHLEDNIYCNNNVVICRFRKLIIVYYKLKNIFNYFLLKEHKGSNIQNALTTLIQSETPKHGLQQIIGKSRPDCLQCSIESYETTLTPRFFGNFDFMVQYENLTDLMLLKNKGPV